MVEHIIKGTRRLFVLMEDRAGPACLALLMAVLAIQVFGRAMGLGVHLTWTDEAARVLFVWSVFLSLPLAAKRGALVHIKLSEKLWPGPLKRIMPKLAKILWGLTALFLAGASLLNINAHQAFPQLTPILGLNQNHLFLVIPISCLMVVIRILAGLWPSKNK